MVWILPVYGHLVNCISVGFLMLNHGEFVVEWLVKGGCNARFRRRTLSRTGIV